MGIILMTTGVSAAETSAVSTSLLGEMTDPETIPEGAFGKPVKFDQKWVVFGPLSAQKLQAKDMVKVPGSWLEGNKSLTPLDVDVPGNRIDFREVFGEFPVRAEAVVFIPFTAEVDGPVTLGFGADWWFEAWLDGEPLLETVSRESGNEASPPSSSNHMVTRGVDAGKHLLAVRFIAGKGSAVLTVGGPAELAAIGATDWAPVKKKAANILGPEVVTGGDFEAATEWLPEGWKTVPGELSFTKEELIVDRASPISGNQSLLIDTTQSKAPMRKLVIPILVDPTRLYSISAKTKSLGGDGYVSVAVQSDTGTGPTDYLWGIGNDLHLYQPGTKKDGLTILQGYTYFNEPEQYLVIRAHGPVKASLDDLSIRAASDSLQFTGHGVQRHPWSKEWFDMKVGDSVETKHTPWANPLAGGALKVLALMPYWEGRHLAELGERISIEHTFLPLRSSNEWVNDWWVRNANREPSIFRARNWISEVLTTKPADVMLLWELSASTLGDKTVKRLLQRVERGEGLVLTGFKQPYWPRPDGLREKALAAFESGSWGQALNPANRMGNLAGQVGLDANIEADVTFYQYGKGRIALVKSLSLKHSIPESLDEYEARTSALAKILRWAGRPEQSARIEGLALERRGAPQRRLTVAPSFTEWVLSQPTTASGELSWWVWRGAEDGKILAEGKLPVPAGESRVVWQAPADLPAGDTFLNVQWKQNGDVVDWATLPMMLNPPVGIGAIHLEKLNPYLVNENPVRGEVSLSQELPAGYSVVVRLEDADGHLWGTHESRAQSATHPFDFGKVPAQSLVHRVTAEILGPAGRSLGQQGTEFSIIRPLSFQSHFFDYQLWQIPSDYLGGLAAKQYRKLGITSSYWEKASTRPIALANIRGVPAIAQNFPPKMKVVGDAQNAPQMAVSLTAPNKIAQMQRVARRDMKSCDGGKWAPLAYGEGHETNMRGFTTRIQADVDFSSSSLQSFRDFANTEYGDLQSLNQAWGTSFTQWTEVTPITLNSALRNGDLSYSLARWINHRRHMDRVYLSYMKKKREAVREFVPGLEATHDNYYGDDSYSGVDLWLQVSELVAGAGIAGGSSLLADFSPPERQHLVMTRNAAWHPSMITEDDNLMAIRMGMGPWHHLLSGYHGSALWTGHFADGIKIPNSNFAMAIQSDLRLTPLGKSAADSVRRIREGVARMVFAGQRDDSGIAVLYSRESEHAATAWRGLNFRNETVQSLSPEKEADQIISLVADLDYKSRRIADAQIRDGALDRDKIKLLILPFSQAITPEAAEAIRTFVHNGGTLLADIRPGVLNQRGEPYPKGVLDDLFGVRQHTGWEKFAVASMPLELTVGSGDTKRALQVDAALVGSGLEITQGKSQGKGQYPSLIENRYGKGRAVLLNMPFTSLGKQGSEIIENVLSFSGLFPLFGVEVLVKDETIPGQTPVIEKDDNLIADGEGFMGENGGGKRPRLFRYRLDGIEIVGISAHRQRKGAGDERLHITWPREGHVYDLLTGKYLGKQSQGEIEMPKEGVAVFAVVPYRIAEHKISLKAVADKQGRTVISADVVMPEEAAQQRHAIAFELLTPEGKPWLDIPETGLTENGKVRYETTLPLDAPKGTWTVTAREAVSRHQVSAEFN